MEIIKPVHWIASSKRDLDELSDEVQGDIGYALYQAQLGEMPDLAKPLKGFGGASVQEIITDDSGGTYRAVYTVRFIEAIFVLHVFQKKSKKGIATPKNDMEIIRHRLKQAMIKHEQLYGRRA